MSSEPIEPTIDEERDVMSDQPRHMRLGAFIMGIGHHVAAWLHPSVEPRDLVSLDHYVRIAKTAEAAKFDALFFADNVASPPISELSALAAPIYYMEPLTLLGALVPATSRIGLVATVSATYLPPYHLARKFATLDYLSGGRAGWNCVTSGSDTEARNFGLDAQVGHGERYQRAAEYLDVVRALWDSWDDDALLFDRDRRRFFDPSKVRPIEHDGPHFRVQGPLQSGRPVQGHPVIAQAGSSADGIALAAATAELVFTAQQSIGDAVAFAETVRDRAVEQGRDRGSVLIMPGLMPFVAETESEAQLYHDELQDLVDPRIAIGLASAMIGADLSRYPLDGPVPDLPPTEGWQSRQKLFFDVARAEGLSIIDLARRVAVARGHKVVIGTPVQIADEMEAWFRAGAADGFNIMPPTLPRGLDDFSRLVIPELQRRGLFRTEYEGTTLREHLGLPRPASPFVAGGEG